MTTFEDNQRTIEALRMELAQKNRELVIMQMNHDQRMAEYQQLIGVNYILEKKYEQSISARNSMDGSTTASSSSSLSRSVSPF